MTAWVVVDTPYFGRSVAPGKLVLANVLVGSYSLRVWHSSLAPGATALELPLTVTGADATATVRMTGLTQ